MDTKTTYCRICGGLCGLIVGVENGRAVSIKPDTENPGSRGYICVKGLQYPEMHHSPERLRQPIKRKIDGSYGSIESERALDEIADRVSAIVDRYGPNAVALYYGTATVGNQLQSFMAQAWLQALQSNSLFCTMTIDQSAKWVAHGRLGMWAGGRQAFDDADVWLLCGTNPLVSLQGSMLGMPTYDPVKRLKERRASGMRLIVIDPVETQTARNADLFLQPIPGEDPTLIAALLRHILGNAWYDKEFCAQYVNGLDALRAAVEPFTVDYAAQRCGVPAEKIRLAARWFAHDARRGMAASGTGPDMAPQSNLAEHLLETLNVVCGRYARAGDRVRNPGVLHPSRPLRAEVIAPTRSWETGRKSRAGNYGTMNGQMMSGIMADEILLEGEGQIRALFWAGSNPAGGMPDQQKVVRALKSLELLVTAEPRRNQTARLAHYVFAPKLALERPDHTYFLESFALGAEPFAQYTPAILQPEPDMDVIDDWYLYWALAKRLGLTLHLAGEKLDTTKAPTTDALLEILARNAQVPLDQVKAYPSGHIFARPEQLVQPARAKATGRFEVMPDDVRGELDAALATRNIAVDFTHRLVSRRVREAMNTAGPELSEIRRRMPYNPAHMHGDDLLGNL